VYDPEPVEELRNQREMERKEEERLLDEAARGDARSLPSRNGRRPVSAAPLRTRSTTSTAVESTATGVVSVRSSHGGGADGAAAVGGAKHQAARMMRPPSATNSNHVRAGEFGDAVEEDSGVGRGSDKQMAEKEAARAARIELLEQARFEAFRVAAQVDIYDLVSWFFLSRGGHVEGYVQVAPHVVGFWGPDPHVTWDIARHIKDNYKLPRKRALELSDARC
jgi:hypothetical protein